MKKKRQLCKKCGKVLELRNKSGYCVKHFGYAKRNRLSIKCDICEKIFERALSEYNKRDKHFCSRICMGKYQELYVIGKNARAYIHGKAKIKSTPEKRRTRLKTYRLIKKGILVRGVCVVCKDTKVQAHHEDYTKPMYVIWLCKRHHDAYHGVCKSKEDIQTTQTIVRTFIDNNLSDLNLFV